MLLNSLRQFGYSFLLGAVGLYSMGVPAMAVTQQVHATVDFAASTPQKNLSGFLHGVGSINPPDSLLIPLKPALWRIRAGDAINYSRAATAGAQMEVVLSDGYGYPSNGWKGRGAPWENNWTHWEDFVHQMAQLYRTTPVYWDVWNEADIKDWNKTQFWNGTEAQYFETYKRAYTILRQELGPNAMIGGPSYANYEPVSITAFLNYCDQNALQVNFLSWHELMRADYNIPSVATNIAYMRNLALSYPNLRIQKIFINESVGPKTQYLPGDILGFLYYMGLGGADGANKGCWNDSLGRNNCSNQSVDGIINPDAITPRAAWWTYKTYADGAASRVKTTSDNPNLVVMASKTPGQVLVGYLGATAPGPANVILSLRNLGSIGQTGASVRVKIVKVPNTGEATLANLVPVASGVAAVLNGATTVTIPTMNLHEEYIIYLTPAP
jgi:xylan 1,4-beta-xylosidase